MKRISVWTFALTLILGCMASNPAFGDDTKTVKGLITGRSADTVRMRADDGSTVTVKLTDDTKVQRPKGLVHLRKEQMSWADLIPGLKISVKAVPDASGNLTAQEISFSKDDLQRASAMQAALTPTEEKVATNAQNIDANKQAIATNAQNIDANKAQIEANDRDVTRRFESLDDYDVKNQATIYFKSGESTLGPDDKTALSQLVAEASKLDGYMIEVQGFADTTGKAAANQTLSRDRATSVIDYLMQEGNISPRRIMAPGAMGMSNPAASNETAQGRKQNRRVEVKVLLNKGVVTAQQNPK
jgi:outer membrane protein OmpA-like peptidoglycan-associated protein